MFKQKKIIDYIGELKINNNTMICMLRKFDTDEYKGVYKAVIKILFGYPNKDFYKVIKESKEKIPKLVYDDTNGNIEILGFLYKKCTKMGNFFA
ncbi:hypothetical protein SD457_06425 [Coprobacillaceae bacterium CR2/5/TPMF4]|nr:hypothetical protein SD457_06425 [Coprobacillaceae bacterium CR2/5/TPMF4]